jgi:hypothetical protein
MAYLRKFRVKMIPGFEFRVEEEELSNCRVFIHFTLYIPEHAGGA